MTWDLDDPVHAQGITCVPVIERAVSVAGGRDLISGHAYKRPVLFLFFTDGQVSGVDLRGRTQDAANIERHFPDALSRASERITQADDL